MKVLNAYTIQVEVEEAQEWLREAAEEMIEELGWNQEDDDVKIIAKQINGNLVINLINKNPKYASYDLFEDIGTGWKLTMSNNDYETFLKRKEKVGENTFPPEPGQKHFWRIRDAKAKIDVDIPKESKKHISDMRSHAELTSEIDPEFLEFAIVDSKRPYEQKTDENIQEKPSQSISMSMNP